MLNLTKDNHSLSRCRNIFLFLLLFILLGKPVRSQVFPLSINQESRFFSTKNHRPFLLTARQSEILPNLDEIDKRLTAFGHQGINIVYTSIHYDDIVFNEKGVPGRNLHRKIRSLKKLARQADLKNMGVMLSPCDSAVSLPEEIRQYYPGLLFRKLHRFSNVMWLLNKGDFTGENLNTIHPKQLKGFQDDGNDSLTDADFRIITDVDKIKSRLPYTSIFRITPGKALNDSIMYQMHRDATAAIFKGSAGIFMTGEPGRTEERQFLNSFAFQWNQVRFIFDTVRWYNFQILPEISPGNPDSLNVPVISAIRTDSSSAMISVPAASPFHLNLSPFGNHIRLTWINTITTRVYRSEARGDPDFQLFMPPLTENRFTHWLLIIQPYRFHSHQVDF